MFAAGLAQHLQLPRLTGLPDDPDAQHPRHGSYRRFYAAVAGEVGQRFQREQQVRVPVIGQNPLGGIIKSTACLHQCRQTLGQQAAFRPGRQTVQHEHTGTFVLLPVFLGGQLGRVIAAGQRARDGDHEHFLRALVGRQPVGHIGAGCAGLALIAVQGLGHTERIQFCRVQIFPIVGHDFQRHTDKVHPAEGIQVGGRVHNDLGFHTVHLQFYRSAADSPPGLFGFLWTSYQFFKNLSSNF